MRAVGFANLMGDTSKNKWEVDDFLNPIYVKAIRGWRDVKFLGFGSIPLPQEKFIGDIDCGEEGATTKAEGEIKFANQGDEEHVVEVWARGSLWDPVGECMAEKMYPRRNVTSKEVETLERIKVVLHPQSEDTYKVVLDLSDNNSEWRETCCLYSKARWENSSDWGYRKGYYIDGESLGEKEEKWFQKHPEYIP